MYNFLFWFWHKAFKLKSASVLVATICVAIFAMWHILFIATMVHYAVYSPGDGTSEIDGAGYMYGGILILLCAVLYIYYSRNAKAILERYSKKGSPDVEDVILVFLLVLLPMVATFIVANFMVGKGM